jgi:hypothetical protein
VANNSEAGPNDTPSLAEGESKAELEQRMEEARESISHTVAEIKETVAAQYDSVKSTVRGVAEWRHLFQEEPLVWSLGALSAGFALGYTLGYAHKKRQGAHDQKSDFANSMFEELSGLGQSVVMPALDLRIKELFGLDFTKILSELSGAKKKRRRKPRKTAVRKAASKKGASKKRRSR